MGRSTLNSIKRTFDFQLFDTKSNEVFDSFSMFRVGARLEMECLSNQVQHSIWLNALSVFFQVLDA